MYLYLSRERLAKSISVVYCNILNIVVLLHDFVGLMMNREVTFNVSLVTVEEDGLPRTI